jgi:hypothetical protein
MVRQLDAISRRLIDDCVSQRRSVERLRLESTLAIYTHALNFTDDVKGLVQGFERGDLDGQMVESNILATIKSGGALIRLPNSEQRRSVREENGRIGFDTANLFEAERLEEFQRGIQVTDGETYVGNAHGQFAGVGHVLSYCDVCGNTGRWRVDFMRAHHGVSVDAARSSLLIWDIVPARSISVSRNHPKIRLFLAVIARRH